MLNRITELAVMSETLTMPVREIRAPYDKYASLRSDQPLESEMVVETSWSELFFRGAFGESES